MKILYNKFIIEQNTEIGCFMILAKCVFHKDLVTDLTNVKGGGMWDFDLENSIFTLYGSSHDFGEAKIEDIISCVNNKKIFPNIRRSRPYEDTIKFCYKNENNEIINLFN